MTAPAPAPSGDWRVVYLRALGAKPTQANVDFLSKWQPWEGGATKNNATNNYFNTTERMPGSKSINSVGVQAYGTLSQGAQAFAKTLLGNPHYAGLVQGLRSGTPDPNAAVAALSTWVSGSPNSAQGAAYAQKVLGGSATVSHDSVTPGRTAPAPAPTVDPATATPLAGPSSQSAFRAQALGNLQDIASGSVQPTDALGKLPALLHQVSAAMPSLPTVRDPGPVTPNSSDEAQAVALAKKYIGVKYAWGGTNAKTGFDCSGLLQTVWKQLGVAIPRTTYGQWDAGKAVSPAQLKPGDAVFFTGSDPQNGKPGHVGMYIGGGKFIEAPHTGSDVHISTLAGRTDFVGARRFG